MGPAALQWVRRRRSNGTCIEGADSLRLDNFYAGAGGPRSFRLSSFSRAADQKSFAHISHTRLTWRTMRCLDDQLILIAKPKPPRR